MNIKPPISYKYNIASFYWDKTEEGRDCLTLLMPDDRTEQWIKSDPYFAVKLSTATKEMIRLGWKIAFIDKPSDEETELDKIKKFRNMS
jgi:hypothetical protein